MLPTISIRGTTPVVLTDALEEATDAIRVAIEKVEQTAPNGRDYPSEADFHAGAAAHRARLADLERIERELRELWEGIDSQLTANAQKK